MSKSTSPATAPDADTDRDPLDRPVGRRFSGNDDVLDIEAELVAGGVDLPNRAIPYKDHAQHGDDIDAAEIRDRIEAETERDQPNKNRIGYLNERLANL